jgi:hypothetical protein
MNAIARRRARPPIDPERGADLLEGIKPHVPMSKRDVVESRWTIQEMQERIDRQNLLLQTLLRLLLEKGVIQEKEFKEWIVYVDEFDGKRDGKLEAQKGIKRCVGCGRVNATKAAVCMYCGAHFAPDFLAEDKSAKG